MASPKVTPAEKQLARLQDQDRAKMTLVGLKHATRIGFRTQQAALKAFRNGRDPIFPAQVELHKAIELLAQGMAAAHVAGRNRSAMMAPAGIALRLGPFDTATRFMVRRMALTPAQLLDLEKLYTAEALRIITVAENNIEALLRVTLAETTAEGLHIREGKNRLLRAFDVAGLTPNNSYTMEAIFRTQTNLAYGAGRWQADQDEAIQEILWGYKYVTVGDDRVRPEHVGWEGVTLPKDDPFWATHWPPNGWGCRCAVISIFDEPDKEVPPPETVIVDGKKVRPEIDDGFAFNPGIVYTDTISTAG
jgi:SPP1 gp7 family putative phage head morphogenesis protein